MIEHAGAPEKLASVDDPPIMEALLFGLGGSGILLFSFAPIGMLLAALNGRNPVSALLLVHSDKDFERIAERSALTEFSATDWSTICCLFAAFGVLYLVTPLLWYVARGAGVFKFLALLNGLMIGIVIISLWHEWTLTGKLTNYGGYTYKFFYLYVAFFVVEAFKVATANNQLSALHWGYALDGIFGTVSALILSAGYPQSFADVVLGPLFLVAVSGGIYIARRIAVEPLLTLAVAFARAEAADASTADDGSHQPRRLATLISCLRNEVRQAAALTIESRIAALEQLPSVLNFKQSLTAARLGDYRIQWRWVAGMILFNAAFVSCGAFLAWTIY